jgi:hypothetical protein
MKLRLIGLALSAAIVCPAGIAFAQQLQIAPVQAGACAVAVQVLQPLQPTQMVRLELSDNRIEDKAAGGAAVIAFPLKGPLRVGDKLGVRILTPGDAPSAPVQEMTITSQGALECGLVVTSVADGRDALTTTAYLGYAFDNFAPAEVGHYALDSPQNERKRYIYGADFGARLWQSADGNRQFWISGEYLNGVRSADVDCRAEPKPPVCEAFLRPGQTLQTLAPAVYVMEHATSVEGYIAPRFEFLTLRASGENRSSLYATAVFGAMLLDDRSDRAAGAHEVGLGLNVTNGGFIGSHLEMGWGKTDLFVPKFEGPQAAQRGHWNRLKVDGYLSFAPARALASYITFWEKLPRIFLQVYSDFDIGGSDADSVQTFIGLELPVDAFFK